MSGHSPPFQSLNSLERKKNVCSQNTPQRAQMATIITKTSLYLATHCDREASDLLATLLRVERLKRGGLGPLFQHIAVSIHKDRYSGVFCSILSG